MQQKSNASQLLQLDEEEKKEDDDDMVDDITVDIQKYNRDDYVDILNAYKEGTAFIHVTATGVIYKAIVKILANMNVKLGQLISTGKEIDYSMVKKFLVDFLMMDIVELSIFAAFSAPNDDIFY